VDHEERQLGCAFVAVAAVLEEQALQVTELVDAIVAGECSLHAFLAENANPHVGFTYHRHVIASVSNCQRNAVRYLIAHFHDNLGFLGG